MRRKPLTVDALDDQETWPRRSPSTTCWRSRCSRADGRVVGFVTVDDVIDVMIEEGTEDALKMGAVEAGAWTSPTSRTPFWSLIRKRAGWLLVLFLSEMLTATAMGRFEEEIARAVVLALFVPLIISSGGNSGLAGGFAHQDPGVAASRPVLADSRSTMTSPAPETTFHGVRFDPRDRSSRLFGRGRAGPGAGATRPSSAGSTCRRPTSKRSTSCCAAAHRPRAGEPFRRAGDPAPHRRAARLPRLLPLRDRGPRAPPRHRAGPGGISFARMILVLGEDFVITYHRRPLEAVDEVKAACAESFRQVGKSPGFVAFLFLERCLYDYAHLNLANDNSLDVHRGGARRGRRELADEIGVAGRNILTLKKLASSVHIVLMLLATKRSPFISQEARVFFRRCSRARPRCARPSTPRATCWTASWTPPGRGGQPHQRHRARPDGHLRHPAAAQPDRRHLRHELPPHAGAGPRGSRTSSCWA